MPTARMAPSAPDVDPMFTGSLDDVGPLKVALRKWARRERAAVRATIDVAAAEAELVRNLGELLRLGSSGLPVSRDDAIVSAYWPLKDEIDLRPWMRSLVVSGVTVALPVVVGPALPLRFHAWTPDDPLARRGVMDIPEPPADAPVVVPAVLVVPLLAFDHCGCRLGYGGGYFDRTLAAMRLSGRPLAVGVALAAQQVERVPTDSNDQPLDFIVTEQGITQIAL